MSAVGHNNFGSALKNFVERIENINNEIDTLNSDKAEVYKEAKGAGLDVKTLRKVVQDRKMEPAERQERDELYDIYKQALGMS